MPASFRSVNATVEAGSGTRDAILRRSVEIASLEGLEGLTIGRLATEFDMSKSGIFRHFGSKQELQLATLDRAMTLFRHEVIEPAAAAEPGLDRLRALLANYLRYLERDVLPGGCFLTAAGAEFDGRPGAVRDAVAASSRGWGRELERQAKLARDKGELPADVEPAQLVFQLSAYTTRANAAYQLYGDRRAFRRARTAITKLLG